VFASIVLNRLRDGVEAHLRTEQAGFRPGRSCNEQIFTLKQIIEKVTAWQKPVMINFIDFRKAFDCVHRPSLWSILGQYGIPGTFVNIILNLYKGSRSCVKLNGVNGDWFEVVTGVRQGCILSPLLFTIVMDWVMKKALINFQGGLEWVDGNRLCDLDYADDVSLIETSQTGVQLMTEEVEKVSGKVGLRMNAGKCKTLVSNNWEDRAQ